MSEEAFKSWRRLQASSITDEKLEVRCLSTGVETGYGTALYAVGATGELRFLVPFGPGKVPKELQSGPNLVAGISKFTNGGRPTSYIDVMVTDSKLDKVFAEVVGEILIRLEDGQPPFKAVIGTISDFRNLLLGGHRRNISTHELIGLIGELVVLEKLVSLDSDSIGTWSGPFGQRHDFRKGLAALEVKTSGRSDACHVTINGSHQLQPPANGELYLAHVRIEPANDGPLSVVTLYTALINSGVKPELLDTALKQMGCDDPTSEDWNSITFSLEGLDFYRVEDGFPRLTPLEFTGGELPPGVVSITYKINLAEARNFLLPQEKILATLKGFLK